MTRHALLLVALAAAAVFSFATQWALASDLNFAGSAQLDEFYVVTQKGNANQGSGDYGFDGLTLEAGEKVAADVSEHVSANVKVCFGCHGFELDMAYLDYRVADELNVRAGRFSPSFGAFNLRHDVGNHKLSDKPLPYDMGRMLRLRTWNLGVLPSPFPDTGVEVDGTHWAGDSVQVDYAVYAVQGFRALGPAPLDIDFRLSHQFPGAYLVDDNGRPTVGGRLALTAKLGDRADMTLGASGMYGTYDQSNSLSYAIFGGDLAIRADRTAIRVEYLARRTEMDTSHPESFQWPLRPGDGSFMKHGGYVEVEQPVFPFLDVIGRVDGLFWVGNSPLAVGDETPLSRHSVVVRYTAGTSIALDASMRIKLSGELWDFSDQDDDGHTKEVGVHAAMVGTF